MYNTETKLLLFKSEFLFVNFSSTKLKKAFQYLLYPEYAGKIYATRHKKNFKQLKNNISKYKLYIHVL